MPMFLQKRLLALALAVWMPCLLLAGCGKSAAPKDTYSIPRPATAESATAESATNETATLETAATAAVMATAGLNATGTAPVVTDPATWAQAGAALMAQLEADPFYQAGNFTAAVQPGFPYLVAVNRAASTVTVYTADADNRYTVPFMAMVCSGGPDTPTGYWPTPISYPWRLLVGPCYGQYATRIWDSYLFHSVPYYSQHKDDLEYDQFNELGTPASLGCIRLAVADVKWIYDNCPIGTPVVIYDKPDDPGPMGKPGTIYTDPTDETLRGWDPTDPDPANPWDDHYLSGTAIRSSAAWEQWNAEQGVWAASLTPTDLQGYSTDSSVAGTRG